MKKVDELMNSRGVSKLYDFLVLPNAQNAIETIGRVVSRPASGLGVPDPRRQRLGMLEAAFRGCCGQPGEQITETTEQFKYAMCHGMISIL